MLLKDMLMCYVSTYVSKIKNKMHKIYFRNKSPNKALSVVTLCSLSDVIRWIIAGSDVDVTMTNYFSLEH
jgi:hypothetical protein